MKMRQDFAVFILTHGRSDNQLTLKTLKRQGYSGRWYLIIDNEDNQQEEYISRYGADHVIVFDKETEVKKTDTMDICKKLLLPGGKKPWCKVFLDVRR